MKNRGFTLVELMVTITIMMIMTAVVLFNYSRFNENSLLNTFAYDMSLTIRQAQTYGIAVRESPEGVSGSATGKRIDTSVISEINFSSPYGVHFDTVAGKPPLLLFLDEIVDPTAAERKGDYVFNEGADTTLQSYLFQRGIVIHSLCVVESLGPCTSVTSIDVTFVRPDPEGKITYNGNTDSRASSAHIRLSNSDKTMFKQVIVESTGQISVAPFKP